MEKIIKLGILSLALGMTGGTMKAHTDTLNLEPQTSLSELQSSPLATTPLAETQVDIPVINTSNGNSKIQMSLVNGQAHLSMKIELKNPKPYLSVRFFTQEDGIYQSIPYSESGKYELTLSDEDIAILRQQVSESNYAAVGIDVLNADEQLPISMLYARDLLSAYDELTGNKTMSKSLSVQPFVIGKDSSIVGTFDNRGTTDKDTLMLIVNGLGRRIMQFDSVPESEQVENQPFQLYAEDFVDSIDKKVSILHLKDGKVIAEVDVPLKSGSN
ncbi:hypothetical protein B835_1960 [Enterococcus mundtii 3F]|uniref:Uncharacterized protein n=1 Tax=Enterococcus faecium TaxID=1352 RepID=A0A0D5MB56_ENTFC|nr:MULTISPECIES: hypothetical protein [Enterococcus]AJY53564.1 hypothetical protein pEfm12493_080 [Enterococcus faecium]MDA9462033.1 hypothetical protein [Enterococcus mundtii 3F]